MKDQAESLRRKLGIVNKAGKAKTISVINRNGHRDRIDFIREFSVSLMNKEAKVLVFEIGTVSSDTEAAASPTLADFFDKGTPLSELIMPGFSGIPCIRWGAGIAESDEEKLLLFSEEFNGLQNEFDFILHDAGECISKDSVPFMMSSDEIFAITTPEPSSLVDIYSTIKSIHQRNAEIPVYLVCSGAKDESQGGRAMSRLQSTIDNYLNKEVRILGVFQNIEARMEDNSIHSEMSSMLNGIVQAYMRISSVTDRAFADRFRDSIIGGLDRCDSDQSFDRRRLSFHEESHRRLHYGN
ncbi:MAG: hypothetical protein ACI4XL_03475 [Bacillus sp. (in: firmicutes)]